MRILVIDAHGGGVGKLLVSALRKALSQAELLAVGTNTTATEAMHKAGATAAATGENAVVVGCRKAELIVGPMGIVIADSLNGEITPRMALAVAQSDARKILIPFHHCDTLVVGIADYNMARLVQEAVECAKAACRPGETPGLDT